MRTRWRPSSGAEGPVLWRGRRHAAPPREQPRGGGPFALSDRTILRVWGAMILLLVASVPLLDYPDQPRRLIGAAATLLAFLMIRSVAATQERNQAEIMRKLDALARRVKVVEPVQETPPADPVEMSPLAGLAAQQTASLLDKVRRERRQSRHG